jgi:flavin-dependent dehydrogenase
MVVGEHGYVGLVRVESGGINVAAAVDPAALRGSSPERVISAIFASAGTSEPSREHTSGWRGTPALTRAPDDVAAERLFRLGDAAGYVEPFTGEGMCWALSQAVAVAPMAIVGARRWDPSLAEAWRRHDARSLGRARRLCRVLAAGLRRPRLVQLASAALESAPFLARPLVRRASREPSPALAISA